MHISVVCSEYTARSIPSGDREDKLCLVFLISSTTAGTKGRGTGGGEGGSSEKLSFSGQNTKNDANRTVMTEIRNRYFFMLTMSHYINNSKYVNPVQGSAKSPDFAMLL